MSKMAWKIGNLKSINVKVVVTSYPQQNTNHPHFYWNTRNGGACRGAGI